MAFFLYFESIVLRDILKPVLSKNEPLAIAQTEYYHIVRAAFPHLLVAFEMLGFNTLVKNNNFLPLINRQMTFLQRVRGVGVPIISNFQLPTFSRKDSERGSVTLGGG